MPPREVRVAEAKIGALKKMGAGPGQYGFPWGYKETMKDPEFMKRFMEGPSGFVIVRPGYNLGKSLAISFTYNLLLTVIVAYLATFTLNRLSEPMDVFRLVGTASILANGAALGWGPIWFGRTWGSTLREMADAIAYGGATGLIFALMW